MPFNGIAPGVGLLGNRPTPTIVGIETQQDYKLGVSLEGVASNERSSNEEADILATQRGLGGHKGGGISGAHY